MADESAGKLSTKTNYGYWAALIGVAFQLVGISWDALMHHFDPGLAMREGIFSLTNPSHLFIMVGIALVIAGVVWGMATGYSLFGPGGMGAAIAIAALIVLSVASAAIAITTGGISGRHEHNDGAAHGDAEGAAHADGAAGDEHGHSFDGRLGEVFAELQTAVREGGTGRALDLLHELAESDQEVAAASHQLVHALGRHSFTFYGDASEAFSNCRQDFESGCYHGVLEAYLDRNPDFAPSELAQLCESSLDAGASTYLRFQCVHGLGHGLSLHFDHNLMQALHYCDFLGDSWSRNSCYGGAFMENIIFAQAPPEAHGGGDTTPSLSSEDALYPCNAVAKRYQPACFQLQSSAILYFNGNDYADAFRQCDRAPDRFVAVCYASMGRDIAGATLRDIEGSIDLCREGRRPLWRECFAGVAMNLIGAQWTTDEALDFCARVPGPDRPHCYGTVGSEIQDIHPDVAERRRECAKVPAAYRKFCAEGANIG